MNALKFLQNEIKNDSLSHAYLIISGNESDAEPLIDAVIEGKGLEQVDVSRLRPAEESKKNEIKVDEIRALLHQINLSAHGKGRLIVIYECQNLNQASGNILLKTLEEPPENVTFFLMASKDSVLSTIKSRCRILKINSQIENMETSVDLKSFFQNSFAEISSQIEKIVKDDQIDPFMGSLTTFLRNEMIRSGRVDYAKLVQNIEKAKSRIANNANSRLVLENIALMVKDLIKSN